MKTNLYITNPIEHARGESARYTIADLAPEHLSDWFLLKEIEIDETAKKSNLVNFCNERLELREAEAKRQLDKIIEEGRAIRKALEAESDR